MEHQLRPLPDGPDEKTFAVGGLRLGGGMFLDGGYTEQGPWQMFLENAQQGTSGAYARQVTLTADSADDAQTLLVLDALESVARGGAIMLRGEGMWTDGRTLALNYSGVSYVDRAGMSPPLTRAQLLEAASAGELVVTLTGRMGQAFEPSHPQPLLWADPARNGSWTLVEHYGPQTPWGQRTLRLPQIAEGQENLRISFRANGGWWINVSNIQVTANGNPVAIRMTGENNSAVGDDNHIAYGHGWFTADLDSRGLTNLEVTFTPISEAPVDVHVPMETGPTTSNWALPARRASVQPTRSACCYSSSYSAGRSAVRQRAPGRWKHRLHPGRLITELRRREDYRHPRRGTAARKRDLPLPRWRHPGGSTSRGRDAPTSGADTGRLDEQRVPDLRVAARQLGERTKVLTDLEWSVSPRPS